jgi:hypothetical protein
MAASLVSAAQPSSALPDLSASTSRLSAWPGVEKFIGNSRPVQRRSDLP